MRGVEKVFLRVVVCRRRDDHKVGLAVALGLVERGSQRKVRGLQARRLTGLDPGYIGVALGPVAGKVRLDIVVLYGRFAIVHHLDPLGHHIDGGDIVVLRQ